MNKTAVLVAGLLGLSAVACSSSREVGGGTTSVTALASSTTTEASTVDTTDATVDTTDTSVDTTDTSVTSTDPLTTDPTTDSTTGSSTSAGTGERIYEDVVSQLNPSADGYTFAQVDQSSIDNFLTYLSGVPAIAAADGFYGAVQIEKAGKPFNRVFAFVPKTPLPDGTMLDFANSVAAPAPVTESMVGGINGQRFTSTDNYEFFIAGDETNGLFMFGAQNDADLQAGVTAFFQSIKA